MPSTSVLKRAILVTGATGNQGGATINALVDAGATETHTILAVTRNPESGSAKRLAARGVKLVQGDLDDASALFASAKRVLGGPDAAIWGVFSVQVAIGKGASVEKEEAQGKALVDAAVSNNVRMFVYASVDRGGPAKSPKTPTDVPHFVSKHRVEEHLLERARASGMKWAILRPTAFMENLVPGFASKLTASAWRITVQGKPLQWIAVRDIGWFGAQAFLRPDEFAGRAISLAGDELSFSEANAIFERKVGHPLPETFGLLTRFIMWLSTEFGRMFRWFYTDGYGADVAALKREHPGLASFSGWLEQDSGWLKKSA